MLRWPPFSMCPIHRSYMTGHALNDLEGPHQALSTCVNIVARPGKGFSKALPYNRHPCVAWSTQRPANSAFCSATCLQTYQHVGKFAKLQYMDFCWWFTDSCSLNTLFLDSVHELHENLQFRHVLLLLCLFILLKYTKYINLKLCVD